MTQQHADPNLTKNLERRIEKLQEAADSDFGGFTRLEGWLLIIASLVLPTIAIIIAR